MSVYEYVINGGYVANPPRYRLLHPQRLGIPPAAVASALAQWAGCCSSVHRQVGYLAQAGPDSLAAARHLAAQSLVPHLLLTNSTADLRALLSHLRCPSSSAGPLDVAACFLALQVLGLTV